MTYQSTSNRRFTPSHHYINKGDMYIRAILEENMNTKIINVHAHEDYVRAYLCLGAKGSYLTLVRVADRIL